MITNAGARTRVLYRWEDELLLQRATGGNRKVRSQKEGEFIINRIWIMEKRKRKAPTLTIKKRLKGYPFYETDDHSITIGGSDRYIITLLHEIVHAMGLGPSYNHHSPAFVKKYLQLLAFQFGWNHYDLVTEAFKRRLL